ncbi:MAG: lamin tail domain-containing protein [Crocosphaera sp.]|nr:lamin tail domain-containing protein [Crocosphaera sp.]
MTQDFVIGGNQIIKRQLPDSASNLYMVDTNNPIKFDANISSWDVYADNALPVQLVIFRKSGNGWSIVYKSDTEQARIGSNSFILSHAIEVKAGDCVGWYCPQKGCVSFDYAGGTSSWFYGASFSGSPSGSGSRTYSISVDGVPISDTSKVGIADIFYDGNWDIQKADQYIEISNQGSSIIDLSGWQIKSLEKSKKFVFPTGTNLQAGQTIKVYTNQVHPESGGFSFGQDWGIWKKSGDTGILLDDKGDEVSTFSYGDHIK